MPIKVFFCEPLARVRLSLRVYETGECPQTGGSYHNAHSPVLGEEDEAIDSRKAVNGDPAPPLDDPRWPTHCVCGFAFSPAANRSTWRQQLVARADTGEIFEGYRALPPGAVWNASWMADRDGYTGPDGRSLICKLPDGHDWMIDGRASNCTLPDDTVHKCWVRHGRPEDGTLHVDKNGVTCAAGAGSIATPKYHGFLHHGHLTDC